MPPIKTAARMTRALAFASVLALAGCGAPSSDQDEGQETETVASPEPSQETAPAATQARAIPADFRGDWGMNAADCEGGAAAKGLLEINADSLNFYESVGTLSDTATVGPNSVQGLFAFEGEGMEWTREMRLQLRDDGDVLVRTELGDGAMPGTFEYQRCTAEGV